jgi:hypothetical protein
MKRWRSALAFVGLLSFAGTAAALLHRWGSAPWSRIDWRHLPTWIRVSPLEDVVAASLRLIALGLAYWLLASALLYALARASQLRGAVVAAGWVTLPTVRRVIDRTIAMAMVTSVSVTPAARVSAGPSPSPPPITIAVEEGGEILPPLADVPGSVPPPVEEGLEKGVPSPAEGPTPGSSFPAPGLAHPPSLGGDAAPTNGGETASVHTETAGRSTEGAGEPRQMKHHVVVPGDNLWAIASAHLLESHGVGGAELPQTEIHRYWLRVVELNREALRSGDPNLIYPGEHIRLPPPSDSTS